MENGSIADAVIANRGLNFAGNGYGYGGNGREFANDGSNAVRINANRELNTQGQDFLSQQISDNADRNNDLSLRSTLSTMASNTADKINDQTRLFAAEVNQLGREQAANAVANAAQNAKLDLLLAENGGS